jgi:hypothetical protein
VTNPDKKNLGVSISEPVTATDTKPSMAKVRKRLETSKGSAQVLANDAVLASVCVAFFKSETLKVMSKQVCPSYPIAACLSVCYVPL